MKNHSKVIAMLLLAVFGAILITDSLQETEASRGDPEYGVDADSDECRGQSGEPGDTITYDVKIRNTGNVNDSFTLFIQHSNASPSGKDWAHIEGLDGNTTGTIPPGETRYFDLIIEIPDFTHENDDALEGLYELKVLAQSTSDGSVEDSIVFEFSVEEMFRVKLWSDNPGKNETLRRNDPTQMHFTLFCRNLGNTDDEIVITVPGDEFAGEKKDWVATFYPNTSKLLTLDSLKQQSIILDLTIDRYTDPGQYTLRVRAESQGDTSEAVYSIIYINLTQPTYGVKLERGSTYQPKVNPAHGSEFELKFTLTNSGNHYDTYLVEVETPLGYGTYKDWIMEFEDRSWERVDTLVVPTDLPGNSDFYISKGRRVDITLYVVVAFDEDEGDYSNITISATSNNDRSKTDRLSLSLSVILPNIRVSNHLDDFWIDPDSWIDEDDDLDINVKIYNDGTDETGPFYVWFYNGMRNSQKGVGGKQSTGLIGMEMVKNIPAGQHHQILIVWEDIPYGENDIYVHADKPIWEGGSVILYEGASPQHGKVVERTELDNTASISPTLQKEIDLRPDLTIIDVDIGRVYLGEETTVTVSVENMGSAKALAGTGQVSLKIGGTSIKANTPSFKGINPFLPWDIDVNGVIYIEFRWKVPEDYINFTIKAVVNHDDDSNRENDRYTSYVWNHPQPDHSDPPLFIVIIYCGLGISMIFIVIFLVIKLSRRKKSMKKGTHLSGPTSRKRRKKRRSGGLKDHHRTEGRMRDPYHPKARTVPHPPRPPSHNQSFTPPLPNLTTRSSTDPLSSDSPEPSLNAPSRDVNLPPPPSSRDSGG